MSKYKPNDEQLAVLNAEGNILVSASAGSGKTSTMIDKVIKLLIEGADIRRILVMTFTNAAAAEMKERLINYIYEHIKVGDKQSALLLKQLNYLPFADITTIHGFCYALYKKYFALIKADPSSEIMDENESVVILNRMTEETIDDYLDKNDENFIAVATHFSNTRQLEEFKKKIKGFIAFLNVLEDKDKFCKQLKEGFFEKKCFDYVMRYADDVFGEIKALSSEYKYIFDDKGYMDDLENVMANISAADKAINGDAMAKKRNFDMMRLVRVKARGVEITAYYAALNKKAKILKEIFDIVDGTINRKDALKLTEITVAVNDRYRQYKRKHNKLDFDDLNYYTSIILQNEKVREEIKNSYDYIFVDEYQDTNYQQESLINSITMGNNVIAVGDIKQAIYRFRYAEPQIFKNRYYSYEAENRGKSYILKKNYRSDREILDFVNMVFDEIMTVDFGGIDYKQQRLSGGAFIDGDIDKCAVFTYENDKDGENEQVETDEEFADGVYSVKEAATALKKDKDGEFVAQTIDGLVGKRTITQKDNEKRLIKYCDIAVLIRTNEQARKIVNVLKKYNIPFNYQDKDNSLLPEREMLVDFMRLLNNVRQDIPLAGVLMSPLYNFGKKELAVMHSANPKNGFADAFLLYQGNNETAAKKERFLQDIEKYRFESTYKPMSAIMGELINTGDFAGVLIKDDRRKMEKINAFLENVSLLECDNCLEDFLFYYDNIYNGDLVSFDSDAVAVMTIHKSKGLEFPIVFIPYAASAIPAARGKEKLFLDRELGVSVMNFDNGQNTMTDSFVTYAAKLKDKIEQREEMSRLLYVALTRAKNAVYVVGKKSDGSNALKNINSFMEYMEYVREHNAAFNKYFREIKLFENTDAATSSTKIQIAPDFDMPMLDYVYPYKEETELFAKYSVSALTSNDGDKASAKVYGGNTTDVGIAYHTLMQYIDLHSDDAGYIEKQIDDLIKKNKIDEAMRNALDIAIIQNILRSDIIRLAARSKIYREQPFIMYTDFLGTRKDKVLVQGIIDLLILGETNVLVDFKVTNGNPNYLKHKYSGQLRLYEEAVKNAMGIQVDKKIVYDIMHGIAVEIE